MKPGHLIAAAGCAAVIVLGVAAYQYAEPAQAPATPTVQSVSVSDGTPSGTATTTATSYTMAQVGQHDSASSCWSAINGKVYDLTNWIEQHPGGPEHILAICGTDGSASFNAQHAGNAQVQAILQQFYIGALAQS